MPDLRGDRRSRVRFFVILSLASLLFAAASAAILDVIVPSWIWWLAFASAWIFGEVVMAAVVLPEAQLDPAVIRRWLAISLAILFGGIALAFGIRSALP